MGLVVSLLLYTLGLNRPGRPWVDRKITSPHSVGARALAADDGRARVDVSFAPGVAADSPPLEGSPSSPGPPGSGRCVATLAAPVSSRLSFDFRTSPAARAFRNPKDERELPSSSPTRRSSQRPTLYRALGSLT
jgi:hypothetical protein